MLIPEEFVILVPFWDSAFFLLGVPFVLWLNNKTRSDWLCLGLGIMYMVLYDIVFGMDAAMWTFFWVGLVVGYVTDYWAVKAKKWKYHPWDPDFGYSYYVGFAWGMVAAFTLSISRIFNPNIYEIPIPEIVGLLFVIPMIAFEYKYGETRRDQYFLYLRALCTFLAFLTADLLGLLFVAIFVGSYIEFAGVYWIKNWLYIDNISFIFLSFGYSAILMFATIISNLISSTPINPLTFLFFIGIIIFYSLDIFWAQKQVEVDTSKAKTAADQYRENYK